MMAHSFMKEKVLRVSQLDAVELDEELTDILQNHFLDVLYPIPSSLSLHRIKPELRAAVRLLIWLYSVGKTGTTFGQNMLNITYSSGSSTLGYKHKILLFLFSVAGDWLSERLEDITFLLSSQPREALKTAKVCSTILKSLSLVNFLMFILYGKYPSLKERVSCLDMAPTRPQTLRQLNYDYMNREILWYGFSEFIFFVLPLLNLFALRNWARRVIGHWGTRKEDNIDLTRCSFCEEAVTMPHVTDCGHVFCYYCISANCLADHQFPCSVCSSVVEDYSPVQL